jgi:glycerophosphoryl diester phosphodiesterase
VGIYLDLKNASVDKLIDIVNKWDMAGEILWYANIDELERIGKLCPECILMPDPGPEENLPKVIERFQPLVIASVWRYYSRSFAAKCHQANAIVIVDESAPTCWEDAFEWDSDGVQTDYPAQLITFLKHRKR